MFIPMLSGRWDELAGVSGPYTLPAGRVPAGSPFLPDELVDAVLIVRMAPGADLSQPYSAWPWREITSDVLQDDGRVIEITQGATDQSTVPFPARCAYAIKNPDGRWTARNPFSPYFPNLRQYTPTWVLVRLGGIEYTRFMGFVKGFSPAVDSSGNKSIVNIEAFGRRQVLDKKSTSTVSIPRSPLTRGIATQLYSPTHTLPLRYWTFEDGTDSGSASEFFGGPSITPSKPVNWASSNTGIPGSNPLPSLPAGTTIAVTVPRSGDGTQWRIEFAFSVPQAPGADTLIATWTTDGTAKRWELWYILADSIGDVSAYRLKGFNSSGVEVLGLTSLLIDNGVESVVGSPFGTILFWEINVHADGAVSSSLDIEILVCWDDQSHSIAGAFYIELFGLLTYTTLTSFATSVTAGRLLSYTMTVAASMDGMHFGQLAFFDRSEEYVTFESEGIFAFASFDATTYACGGQGENGRERLERVAAEDGIEINLDTVATSTLFLGVQSATGTMAILDEAALASNLILYDGFNGGFIAHNVRSRYSQSPVLTLSGVGADLFGSFEPTDDDLGVANTFRVARRDGSSSIGRVYDGDNGIDAIGEVGAQLSSDVIFLTDEFVPDRAQWEARVASTPGFRYPPLGLNMRRRPALAHKILSLFMGNLIELERPFTNIMPPENERLIIEGWHEQLAKYVWQIDFNCSRGDAYNVWRLTPDEYSRVGTAASSLGANMTTPGELGVADGTFETGTSGWAPTDGTFVQSSAQAHDGTQSGLLTVTGAPIQTFVRATANVVPGEYYSVVMWVYSATGDAVSAAIDWYDASNTYISTDSTAYVIPAATWTRIVVAAAAPIAPVAAATAQYGPTITGSPTAGDAIWLDDVSFRGAVSLVTPGVQWVDSATYPASFPMPLRISGTKVTCTDIIGTASPQIAVLSNTTKAFRAGDAVQIWQLNSMGL